METVTRNRRDYNGNPLAYFRQHPGEFEDYKNRGQLSKGDSGMYRSLLRAGQLEKAFPEANELLVEQGRRVGRGDFDLSLRDITKIINSHKIYDGNASKASRHMRYNSRHMRYNISTILRVWKRGNLKIRKYKLDNSEIRAVLSSYKKYDCNASTASKHLLCSPTTIQRYWREKGLEIKKRGERISKIRRNKILNAYESSNGNATRASKSLFYPIMTIIKYWREAGKEIRKRGRPRKN